MTEKDIKILRKAIQKVKNIKLYKEINERKKEKTIKKVA